MKPFKLDNIKKVTREEIELVRALYEYLPATEVRDRFHVAVRRALMKHLGQDIRYYLSQVTRKPFINFVNDLPQSPVLLVLGLTPIEKKAFVYIDHRIASVLISKLLGSSGVGMGELRPLTETEQGVLQYLVMQVLSQIHSATGREARVHFRFEKFIFEGNKLLDLIAAKDNVCTLTVEVGMFDQSGFVKLVFPDPFLTEALEVSGGAGSTKRERKFFGQQLARMGFMKTSMWAEAGRSELAPYEIKDLELGDVVLFDETGLELADKKLSGEVVLHFGPDIESGVKSDVSTEKTKLKCTLKEIVR